MPLLYTEFFIFGKKKKKSRFLVEFQSFIFWQFWAEIAALTVFESLPKVWLKSLKIHNPKTVNPNATCNVSLESYRPCLSLSRSFKTSTTLGAYSNLHKIRKGCFGCLRPLGVNKFHSNRVIKLLIFKFQENSEF